MSFEFEVPLGWFRNGAAAVGVVSLVFGIFTALLPQRSIALYGWLMARINWRVVPIDEAREIRTTRFLGSLLTLLALAALTLLFIRGI